MSALRDHGETARALRDLYGLLTGFAADGRIDDHEVTALGAWLDEREHLRSTWPFSEVSDLLAAILEDGVVDARERADLLAYCHRFRAADTNSLDLIDDMRELAGFLAGIAADGEVTDGEVVELARWLQEHERLRDRWPYDQLTGLLVKVITDRSLDSAGRMQIVACCLDLATRASADDEAEGEAAAEAADEAWAAEAAAEAETAEEAVAEAETAEEAVEEGETAAAAAEEVVVPIEEPEESIFALTTPPAAAAESTTAAGLCAVDPALAFDGRRFCVVGQTRTCSRQGLYALIAKNGGVEDRTVSEELDYLVIGADSAEAWAFAPYGRNVERVLELRRAGADILIVREGDVVAAALGRA